MRHVERRDSSDSSIGDESERLLRGRDDAVGEDLQRVLQCTAHLQTISAGNQGHPY